MITNSNKSTTNSSAHVSIKPISEYKAGQARAIGVLCYSYRAVYLSRSNIELRARGRTGRNVGQAMSARYPILNK